MITPTLYRKKPVVVEAMRLSGVAAEYHAVYQWIEKNTLGSFEPLAEEKGDYYKGLYDDMQMAHELNDDLMMIAGAVAPRCS